MAAILLRYVDCFIVNRRKKLGRKVLQILKLLVFDVSSCECRYSRLWSLLGDIERVPLNRELLQRQRVGIFFLQWGRSREYDVEKAV